MNILEKLRCWESDIRLQSNDALSRAQWYFYRQFLLREFSRRQMVEGAW